jgi:hypothetical protein
MTGPCAGALRQSLIAHTAVLVRSRPAASRLAGLRCPGRPLCVFRSSIGLDRVDRAAQRLSAGLSATRQRGSRRCRAAAADAGGGSPKYALASAVAEAHLTRRCRSEPSALGSLVETAMLAACTGLAYHLSSAFRLEAYLGAFFPLPPVLSAARWSGAAAAKTMVRSAPALGSLPALSPRCAGCHHAALAAAGRASARIHVPPLARCDAQQLTVGALRC